MDKVAPRKYLKVAFMDEEGDTEMPRYFEQCSNLKHMVKAWTASQPKRHR